MNCEKTFQVFYGKKNKLTIVSMDNTLKTPLTINNIDVKTKDQYLYLGAIIDSTLNMKPQVQATIRNGNYRTYQLRAIRDFIDEETAILIYKQFILAKIEYASILTDSAPTLLTEKLQVVQNKALRLCKGIRKATDCHIEDLHNDCKIDKLEKRRENRLLCQMYKWSRNIDNIQYNQEIRTRQDREIKIKVPVERNCKAFGKSALVRGELLWREFSKENREITYSDNVNVFRQRLASLTEVNVT